MTFTRRAFASLALAAPLFLAACAGPAPYADTQVRAALAPTGALRVGVYPGSPSSLVKSPATGEEAGVARDLGVALGERLGVPVRVVQYSRVEQVIEALQGGQVDFTFTNASEARSRIVDFTPPLVHVELGYLVPEGSPIRFVADVDRPGMRIGVTQGSTSQTVLGRQFKSASMVPAASMGQAKELLRGRAVDAFATNKGILFELSDGVPNSRVLDGRWGLEHMAIAIPKGRAQALPFVTVFGEQMRSSGRLEAIIQRAGLRGTAAD
jgi:polar amino acid transport system substrate-binding protein